MNLPTLTDSRGQQSKTLPLIYIGFTVVTGKFILAGLDIGIGHVPAMTGHEYATAIAAVLGGWLWREKQARPAAE